MPMVFCSSLGNSIWLSMSSIPETFHGCFYDLEWLFNFHFSLIWLNLKIQKETGRWNNCRGSMESATQLTPVSAEGLYKQFLQQPFLYKTLSQRLGTLPDWRRPAGQKFSVESLWPLETLLLPLTARDSWASPLLEHTRYLAHRRVSNWNNRVSGELPFLRASQDF